MRARDLPSLSALPTLEAAARLGSFKDAAKELHLTPSAVSQQVRALEAELGVVLFERDGRHVKLSKQGEAYAREVRQVLRDLASATQRLRARADEHVLSINTVDFVAYEFLLPRLSLFRQHFPGLELRMQTSVSLIDLGSSDVDLVIRVGGGPWPSCHTEPFGSVVATPVASPALARTLHRPEDVLDHALLEVRGQEYRGWHAVVERLGRPARKATILSFETYFETLRAAEQGLGVAAGVFPLTSEWVLSGRLAVPFALREVMPGHISLLSRVAEARRPLYAKFLAWLSAQYAGLPALPEGRVIRSGRASGSGRSRPAQRTQRTGK